MLIHRSPIDYARLREPASTRHLSSSSAESTPILLAANRLVRSHRLFLVARTVHGHDYEFALEGLG